MRWPGHPAYLDWDADDAKAFWLGIGNAVIAALVIALILRRGLKVPV